MKCRSLLFYFAILTATASVSCSSIPTDPTPVPEPTSSPSQTPAPEPTPTTSPTPKPTDIGGWTELKPSPDSRLIYVSDQGDDAVPLASVSKERPLKTIAKARSYLRDNQPDWLLLKSGSVFNESFGELMSGRSKNEPMVVTSYGDGQRPKLWTAPGSNAFVATKNRPHSHFWVVGLHLEPKERPTNRAGGVGVYLLNQLDDVLFEDNYISGYSINFVIQAVQSQSDVRLRRNVIVDARNPGCEFFTDPKPPCGHSQGIYSSRVHGLLLLQNIFHHNGWLSKTDSDGNKPTMFNHSMYLHEQVDLKVVENISLVPSSMHIKMAASDNMFAQGVLIDSNFMYDGEIGISIGGNGKTPSRFKDVVVKNNVMQEIGLSRLTDRPEQRRLLSWGIGVSDNLNATYLRTSMTAAIRNTCFMRTPVRAWWNPAPRY